MAVLQKMIILLHLVMSVVYTVTANQDSVYVMGKEKMAYDAACSACASLGMLLPLLKSSPDLQKLKSFIEDSGASSDVWIGLRLPDHSENSKDFRWLDNSSLLWENWERKKNEPDNLSADKCVLMKRDGGWYSRSCGTAYHYVCESDMSITPLLSDFTWKGLFVRITDQRPTGYPLEVINTPLLLRCVSHCLRESGCDVIVLSGSCSLYPPDVSLIHSPQMSDDVIYQKARSVL